MRLAKQEEAVANDHHGSSPRRDAGEANWAADRLARRMGGEFVPISSSSNAGGDARNVSRSQVLPMQLR